MKYIMQHLYNNYYQTCCQGLSNHKYRGYGPGIPSILELINENIERDKIREKNNYYMYYNVENKIIEDNRYDELNKLFLDVTNENLINLEDAFIKVFILLYQSEEIYKSKKKEKENNSPIDNNDKDDEDDKVLPKPVLFNNLIG